ncbi:class I SAM-dependent methyltransferase [Kordiimonas aquimaris]|uniref:class I SAM-dependent methyltransferase n=1 Tax=Kordiimonas aquimaris TaxID=707591 RepID=UPI0021CF3A52|nr:class I SAM-dependent methyltransferase [Kordiimonas aquimaris]
MQNAAVFWDKVSEKYAKAPISDEEAYLYTLNKTRGYLKATDHVLEVGCGTGSTALLLAENVREITASDLSGKMIEIGRAQVLRQGVSNVNFIQADVLDADLVTESYDAVLAHNMLHLLEDAPAALQAIKDHLKPDGLFISKTVCSFGQGTPMKWRLLKILLPIMQFLGKAPYVNFMKAKDWETMIADAGFKIIESGNFPKKALSRYIVARKT